MSPNPESTPYSAIRVKFAGKSEAKVIPGDARCATETRYLYAKFR